MKSLIGWDLSRGGGQSAVPLAPGQALGQIPLYLVPEWGYSLEMGAEDTRATQRIDVWGLDPRLTICLQAFHQLAPGARPPGGPPEYFDILYPASNMPIAVAAKVLARPLRPDQQPIELYTIPAAELFGNGGILGDGCELSTAAQGVRFEFRAAQDNIDVKCDFEVAATLIAIPNVTFGCVELAQAVIGRVSVTLPTPYRIPRYIAT